MKHWIKKIDDISEARIIKGMVGRELTDRFPKRENQEIRRDQPGDKGLDGLPSALHGT